MTSPSAPSSAGTCCSAPWCWQPRSSSVSMGTWASHSSASPSSSRPTCSSSCAGCTPSHRLEPGPICSWPTRWSVSSPGWTPTRSCCSSACTRRPSSSWNAAGRSWRRSSSPWPGAWSWSPRTDGPRRRGVHTRSRPWATSSSPWSSGCSSRGWSARAGSASGSWPSCARRRTSWQPPSARRAPSRSVSDSLATSTTRSPRASPASSCSPRPVRPPQTGPTWTRRSAGSPRSRRLRGTTWPRRAPSWAHWHLHRWPRPGFPTRLPASSVASARRPGLQPRSPSPVPCVHLPPRQRSSPCARRRSACPTCVVTRAPVTSTWSWSTTRTVRR